MQTPLVEIKPVGELTRLLVVLQLAGGGIVVYLLDLLRQNQPNLVTLGSSLFVLVAIIYLQGQGPPHVILSVGVRVELPIMSTSKIGQRGTFPIKLLYSPDNSIMFLVHPTCVLGSKW